MQQILNLNYGEFWEQDSTEKLSQVERAKLLLFKLQRLHAEVLQISEIKIDSQYMRDMVKLSLVTAPFIYHLIIRFVENNNPNIFNWLDLADKILLLGCIELALVETIEYYRNAIEIWKTREI